MPARRALALLASTALAAVGLLVATNATPGTQTTAAAATRCEVKDATLTWGLKASFRAYITSSIAKGDWTTSGNASYKTPNFTWSKGTGSFDPAGTTGQVSFSGRVHFTGHEGMLDSTFSNPRLTFNGANKATLVLDYTGVAMSEALAGSANPKAHPGIAFASLALGSGTRGGSGATTTFTAVPTSITKEGYAAFGSYEAGTPLDPMTISITTRGTCGAASAKPTAKSTTKATTKPSTAKPTPKSTTGSAAKPTPAKSPTATKPTASGTTASTPGPTIVSATGLAIPAPGARTPASSPTPDPSATRELAVIGGGDAGGGFGEGFLLGLAGFGVGIAATLLIQFAHLRLQAAQQRLQAKRKDVETE